MSYMGRGPLPAKCSERTDAMDLAGFNWTLIAIIGAAVLVLVIAYAALRNRTAPGPPVDTEAATRQVYEEEDRAHRGESDDVP